VVSALDGAECWFLQANISRIAFLTIAQAGSQVEFTGRQRLEPLNCALMRRIALPTSGSFRAGPPVWEIEKGRGAVTRLRNCFPHPGAYGPEDHSATGQAT